MHTVSSNLFYSLKTRVFLFSIVYLTAYPYTHAQRPDTLKNLLLNGNFEEGNSAFYSNFKYNPSGLKYGEYSVTQNSASLNEDLKNPEKGDHTSGKGYFFIANSNAKEGNKTWCENVLVIPNSMYKLSFHFCNLYKKKPSYGIMISGYQIGGVPKGNDPEVKVTINGKQVGETQKDIFQMFQWLHTDYEWYSGKDSGYAEICIENLNLKAEGNDLALDDICFSYIKTMPLDYEPYINSTVMNEAYIDKIHNENPKDPERLIALNNLTKGDSIAPGIRTMYHIKKKDNQTIKNQKIPLTNLKFLQSDSTLLPEAKLELDKLATWMNGNPTIRIRIEGHTDNIGNSELNLKLSEIRTQKAKEYLVNAGINQTRIDTIGYGGSHPIADNTNEETRKLNRRIEFIILNK